MQVKLVPAARIADEWLGFAERLWPAVRQDPSFSLRSLQSRLIAGSALLFEVSDGAEGLWAISLDDDDGLVAWTVAIAGRIDGGFSARVRTIRRAVAALEKTLALAGVKAHRVCGREAWGRLLPDYAAFEGARNGLEKRLA